MSAVGTSGELQDRGAVDEAIEKRRGQGWITEIISPGFEVDVGRQRGGSAARASIKQPIVDGAGLSLGFTLQAVEAKFVDQQEVQPRINSQLAIECAICQCCREFLEQFGAGRVANMVPQHAGGLADGLENSALAQSGLADKDDVLSSANEVAGNQLLDGPPIHSLGIERPIESFQGGQLAELRIAQPPIERPLPASRSGLCQQAMEEFQMAQVFSLRRLKRRIERGGIQGDSQCFDRGSNVVMQVVLCRRLARLVRSFRGRLPREE